MVIAKFSIDESRGLVKMTVKGHAGQNAAGHDIVCAACSILAKTLEQNVKMLEAEGLLRSSPDVKDKKGDFIITCRPKKDEYREVCLLFCYIQAGYQLLAYNYPDFVAVEMFGEDTQESLKINKESLT